MARMLFLVLTFVLSATLWALGVQEATIKGGDKVRIICAEEPSLNRDYEVTDDGLVLVDFLGAVKVSGLTERQAGQTISRRLVEENIVEKATVTVQIVRNDVPRISFAGEVRLPAETPWRQGIKLSDVLRLAEPTPNADLSKVSVTNLNGRRNVYDLTKGQDPVLVAGDRVSVPKKATTVPTPPVDPVPTPNPTLPQVIVAGSVNRPGSVSLNTATTLGRAIQAVGGLTSRADSTQIVLERAGKIQALSLPADQDFSLQAGDRIRIGAMAAADSSAIEVFGAIVKPGRYSHSEGLTLAHLLTQAGGFTQGANRKQIRVLSVGEDKPRTYNLEEIERGYRGDVLLKPGQKIEVLGPRVGPDRKTVTKAAGVLGILFLFGL